MCSILFAGTPTLRSAASPALQNPTSKGPGSGMSAVELSKRILGRWENPTTGFHFLEGGGISFYRQGGKRITSLRMYQVVAPNRIRIQRVGGSEVWVVKKVTKDELVVGDGSPREQRYKRVKTDAAWRKSPAVRCETIMQSIMIAEERYMIDHAVYKAVRPGESFVRAGLSADEPSCPAGGKYSVTVDKVGSLAVHCTIKDHDFGGEGLR